MMLREADLNELLAFNPGSRMVSLYLNIDPVDGTAEVYRNHLRNMLKEVDLPDDVELIERFFNHEFNRTGRSVVVFSCAKSDWFRAYPLAVPLRNRVRIGERPHVKPLADLLDVYGGYGVALVDKQGARFFYFHLGELREQEGILGESVRRTKRGGGSRSPGQGGGVAGETKYVDEMADRNAKEAADFAANFFAENKVRRVLIGGTDDNVALFRNHLPKAWQSLVVGVFPISMTASHTEVLEKAMDIGLEAERKRDARLVDAVITGASKGSNGVVNLDDTLSAVNEGRVHTLLIQEGLRAPGNRCTGCGYITTQELTSCPFCGGAIEEIRDAVEMAVRKVMQSGGEVEVLHDDLELSNYGHIG
ncbi:MAG: hypothetical protein ACK2TV_14415, partial [Anaerolineales bacterium]